MTSNEDMEIDTKPPMYEVFRNCGIHYCDSPRELDLYYFIFDDDINSLLDFPSLEDAQRILGSLRLILDNSDELEDEFDNVISIIAEFHELHLSLFSLSGYRFQEAVDEINVIRNELLEILREVADGTEMDDSGNVP